MTKLPRTIFLIGFMGSGKTSVSEALHTLTGAQCVEMDARIVAQEGMPVTEIFAAKGEAYFRACETRLLQTFGTETTWIVSCGGGVAMRAENVALMRERGKIILLTARPDAILSRVKDDTSRPLLNGHMNETYIAELMEQRRPKYEAAADFTVDTSDRTIAQVCQAILNKI